LCGETRFVVLLARLEPAAASLEDTPLCEGPGSPDFTSRVQRDAGAALGGLAYRFGAILKVVGPLGLEPRTPGLKVRCSTS
jgi:hypothetical protein